MSLPPCPCGAVEIVAIRPGSDGESFATGESDFFRVSRPVADAAWCQVCWDRAFRPGVALVDAVERGA